MVTDTIEASNSNYCTIMLVKCIGTTHSTKQRIDDCTMTLSRLIMAGNQRCTEYYFKSIEYFFSVVLILLILNT